MQEDFWQGDHNGLFNYVTACSFVFTNDWRPKMSNSALLPQDDLMAELGVSRPTLQRYRREGTGPAWFRLPGGAVRYRRSDVDLWLEARRVAVA
jgi:excisionase family DNA binding protein